METASTSVDFCILGAGIAGLSLADALSTHDQSVAVIEKNTVASGASGTPGALVNPATGRRATKTWKAEQCYPAIRQNLEKVQKVASEPFYQNNGLLRPALLEKMALKMRKQYEKNHWPEGWCLWQDKSQIQERHPGINCVQGGLWLPIGLTVDAGLYLQAYTKYLRSTNVLIKEQGEADINQTTNGWKLINDQFQIECKQLVFAIGYATVHHPFWKFLPLKGVKGQVATFQTEEKLSFDHSISSLGYMARLGNKNQFIQGSTYEHNFEHINPDTEGEQYLRKRMSRTLPELAKKARVTSQWAGVRLFTPDKKPVLGAHPNIENLHVFTALGSKGLMYGKFLANHYSQHLLNDTPLFEEIAITRF